ncbi:ABC transporter substrate-binding protein [Paenibacillus eucommiae]|uniref:ABC-type glycerol-3-phosphate transport system substrate-binding protein n=1 Tax=Paenibacillus eucommiae TaxID=1355755 RepID=A0ABS4IPF3_9BACL|nr:sugar ABC transporter substrate-binding protein [Paenibacillus eucommiae]MBP1989442.1 ABC-type glycerol-3-phosphate transport system substrate-binding protein [Paenibacillus eucommiae]
MKRLMRRRAGFAWIMACILMFTIFTTACSNNSGGKGTTSTPAPTTVATTDTKESEPPVEEEKHDPVTLKLVTWHVGNNQELFDMFHKKYPWITIEPVIPDVAQEVKVAAMQAAGDPADLTWINDLSAFTKDDMLEDLTPYIAKDPTIQSANIVDGILEAYKTKDKTYALPFTSIFEFIVVNKDLLKKHGMEMPGNDWTYDDFLEMARKATDPAASEYGLSFDSMMVSQFKWILPVANGNAANLMFLNEDFTQSVAHTPGVLADLKWLQELTTKWHVRPSGEEGIKLGWETANNFLTGKVLFTLGADWVLPGYQKDATFEWDILPLPKGKVKQATVSMLGAIGIPSASKHKEEAFKWISFLYEVEAQKWMARNGSNTFIIDPELDKAIDEAPVWQGKNVEAVKMSRTMCCLLLGTPELDFYQVNVDNVLTGLLENGGDINSIVPSVEAFNKKTLETRKLLGW